MHSSKQQRRRSTSFCATHEDGPERQSGWSLPWPFKPAAADEYETEYEVVYVTDNGTEDADQQPKEAATSPVAQGQQQQVPPAVADEGPAEDVMQDDQQSADAAAVTFVVSQIISTPT